MLFIFIDDEIQGQKAQEHVQTMSGLYNTVRIPNWKSLLYGSVLNSQDNPACLKNSRLHIAPYNLSFKEQ